MGKPFKKITLDNGLRIILVPQEHSLATTVLVLVAAGSKYETKEINGLSHFLEHMCFKGTKKRPHSIDIVSELDSIGASYNAFTGEEYTGYYAKAEPRHLKKISDIVTDIYLNQVFSQDEINKERGVIIEEINMYEDLPMRQINTVFMNLLYGDQPAGWDIAGRKEVIQKLNRENFINYRRDHYLAESTIVVVAGKFDEAEAIEDIKKNFAGIEVGGKKQKIKTIESQDKPGIKLKFKGTDQTHLVLGVRAFDMFDKRKYAIDLLSDILGGGMSSRLFQKIRNELGAAYYVNSGIDLYTDHGYFSVSAGIDNKRAGEVIEAMLSEFKKAKEILVNKEEFERAKEYSIGHLMLGLETSSSLASYYGMDEVHGEELITPEELASNIRAIKIEEIQSVAQDIFKDEKLNLAIIGPFKEESRFEKILTLN